MFYSRELSNPIVNAMPLFKQMIQFAAERELFLVYANEVHDLG